MQGHQRPRVCLVPDIAGWETAEISLEICELAGLDLDPWQQFLLTSSLGEREDGKWAAFEVGVVVPRQNGKGGTLEARELTGLFAIDEERLIIHSAHEQATSSEHFRRLLTLIESTPDFDREVLKAPTGKGAEAIELRDGSRILFKTRTGGGGRGLTGDLVVLDEAMIIPVSTTAALVPTMAARSMTGNPQLWYTGSAVDQQQHEHGVVLARVRERGMRGALRLMYADWSVPGDDPSQVPEAIASDPAMWAMANPGMGIRISEEHIGDERGALPPRQFAVERLGVGDWPATGDDGGVIALATWRALADSGSVAVDPVCFAIDMPPDRSTATIAAAGKRPDGLRHIEVVDRRAGSHWVVDRAVELTRRHKHVGLVVDPKSPAASLIPDLNTRLNFEVTEVTANEHAQACGMLYDAATAAEPTLRHLGTSELDAAIKGAAKRTLGDAWAWARKSSAVDVSPLVAVTLANWGSATRTPAEPWVVVA